MTAIPQLTALPSPPQRSQDPAVFADRADTFIDALPGLVDEINGFGPALIAATNERVTNQAAGSFAGAAAARDDAVTARNAAQAAAASVASGNIVHRTGDEAIDGIKTFSAAPVLPAGFTNNGHTLHALSGAGVAMAEAADAPAQKALLGLVIALVQDFEQSGSYAKPANAIAVQVTMWGGGGGGAGGVAPGGSLYGGAGGTGACVADALFLAADLPASISVTVGAGGVGGTGGGSGQSSAGGDGGATAFGLVLKAIGGKAGLSGSANVTTVHAGGGRFAAGDGGAGGVYINSSGGPGLPGGSGSSGFARGYAPCPGGGGGAAVDPGGGAGGLGSLRGPVALTGGGGAGGNASAGTAGLTRTATIPGTGGGGGGGGGGAPRSGGAGGSGAGGGGGAAFGSDMGNGGAGGGGFCRVITWIGG